MPAADRRGRADRRDAAHHGGVNLRFIIYGLGLAPALRREPGWRKLLLGYLNADLGYALFVTRYSEDPEQPHARSLYLGIVSSTGRRGRPCR